jgi:HAD superfamily hydrolase (TIGR01459 family)
MNRAALPVTIRGLHEIAEAYDVLICDVWGVVHNGQVANPSSIAALRAFRRSRGPVILLTNAPRIAGDVEKQFARIGVPTDCYDAIETSGQAARDELTRRAGAAPLNFFHLGPSRDDATHVGIPRLTKTSADDAEIVLCTGLFDDETEGPEDYRGMLERFRARDLLMICANPDVTVRRGDAVVYCAGAIARLYEQMGGKVLNYGKPYAPIFEEALAKARALRDVQRPLVIGDGLDTDIRGANAMGWPALFIAGGLFGLDFRNLPPEKKAARASELFASHGVHARAMMTVLAW